MFYILAGEYLARYWCGVLFVEEFDESVKERHILEGIGDGAWKYCHTQVRAIEFWARVRDPREREYIYIYTYWGEGTRYKVHTGHHHHHY